jgi:hypothetical protein
MLNTRHAKAWARPMSDAQSLPCRSPACAERIVRIAGIGAGVRVLYPGGPDTVMDAAVANAGARLMTGEDLGRTRFRMDRARADIVLCALAAPRLWEPVEHLRIIRRYLRPGGRLVVWTTPDPDRAATIIAVRLQRLIRAAEFTSIIVGRMPSDAGDLVVATGKRVA